MSAKIQAVVHNYKSKVETFCIKYELPPDVKDHFIKTGLDVKKTNLTNQTRFILATLYHKYKAIGQLRLLRKDIKFTFQISDSSFDNLKKLKPLETMKVNAYDDKRNNTPCKFVVLEERLAVYLELCQKKLGSVHSGPFIQSQALVFFDQLKANGLIDSDVIFTASNGWLQGFKKRRNLKYKASRGTTDTIDKKEAYKLLDTLIRNNGLLDYLASDIFNLDETVLFWRTLAKKGLVFGGEAPKVALSKDRVTLVVAASLTGEKLPLCLIGTANQPRAFNNNDQKILKDDNKLYYSFKKDTAWMTQHTFYEYLKYLDNIFKSQNRKVVMLCDAPSVHLLGQLDANNQLTIQEFDNLKLIYLPSNCTCVLQPADQGIIRSFKARYRYHLLTKLCAKADTYLNDTNSDLTTFKLNKYIEFKDCVEMSIMAWADINQSVIVNAWVKSTIASYWHVPKIKSTLYLQQLALKQCLKRSQSIFKDLDVFNSFSVFEDMGNMDYSLMTSNDLAIEVSQSCDEITSANQQDPDLVENLTAPTMEAYNM